MSAAWNAAGDVVKGAGSAAGSVSKSVFGGSDDPGILGLGNQKIPKHDIDKNNYQDPNSAAFLQDVNQRETSTDQRQAPQSDAAQQDGIERYNGTDVANNERSGNVNLPSAAQGSAFTGQVTNADGTNINRTDEQFRTQQQALIDQLTNAANGNGPSLAGAQLKAGQDRALAQQLAAAASTGGNSSLSLRNNAMGTAAATRQTDIDSANMKVQEQLNARNALGGVLDNARTQDIGVNEAQANLTQQKNLVNAGAANDMTKTNVGAINTQGLTNQAATNAFATHQGDMTQQNQQFNAGQTNTQQALQANLTQQAALATQAQENARRSQNSAQQEQTDLANLQAKLQQEGYNDAQIRFLLDQKRQQDEADRQGNEAYEANKTAQETGLAASTAGAYNHAADARASFVRNLMSQKVVNPNTGAVSGGGDSGGGGGDGGDGG